VIIGVPKESVEGENRVSVVPESVQKLTGMSVFVESGAGLLSGYSDSEYAEAGARIVEDAKSIFSGADIILKVNPPNSSETEMLKEGATIISFLYPTSNLELVEKLASNHINAFALDLVPRISRAQSMDALSSQSNLAGYKAAIIAADLSQKIFPMMMTAAGTIPPAKVFVLGAGVAGLQAIATAKRLGAIVEAYDVRPVVKEQVESLGASFLEIGLESKEMEGAGGYAKGQSPEFYKKQQLILKEHAKSSDVIITTALVAGRRAPILITDEVVRSMKVGSVIVDLAAEQGGNCELTELGKIITKHGVIIAGLTNLPSMIAHEASRLFSRNVVSFLSYIIKEGKIDFDLNDAIVSSSLVVYNGQIVNTLVRAALENKN
jgi:NAD(P) transhydrogenase subunit alpha